MLIPPAPLIKGGWGGFNSTPPPGRGANKTILLQALPGGAGDQNLRQLSKTYEMNY
jgi:hypothetical protein